MLRTPGFFLLLIILLGISLNSCDEEADSEPIVKFLAPAVDAIVSKNFVVHVEASVDIGIRNVELYLNNLLIGSAEAEPYTFTVNIEGYVAGNYTLKAIGYSNSGKGKATEITIAIAAPTLENPLEFTASKGAFGHKISLNWARSPGALSYEVYKLDTISMDYVKIATVANNYFEDLTIEKTLTKFYYKVRAFNSDTIFSHFSDYDYGYSSGKAYDLIRSFGREGTNIDEFGMIVHLAYNNGELFVPDDYNNRIVKYSPEGNFIGLFQSYNSYPIAPYFFGDKFLNTYNSTMDVQSGTTVLKSIQTHLIGVRQVTVDDENYIYAAASNSNKVAKYDMQGNLITQWGSEGDLPGQFNGSWGIAFYHNNIVVSNYYSGKVQFFSKSGQFIKEWVFPDASNGHDLFVKDDFIYIACGRYIAKTDYEGLVVEKIYGEFDLGTSIVIDENDDMYITDPYQRKIYVYRKSM